MELKDYWLTIRRRWKTIVAVVVLAVAVAGVVTWQTTPQYASSARLFVKTAPSDTAAAYQGELFASQRVTSYAEVVTGRTLAERVADAMGNGLTADDLLGKVEATVVPETVILELTATDPDPLLARDIAQAYAEGLSDYVEDIETIEGSAEQLISATVSDDAEVSSTPVSPQPVRNLGLAMVLGLLIGVALAVARELLDTSVKSPTDVAAVTEAPLLASIQVDGPAAARDPAEVLDDITPWAEAFRVLRTNMQYVQVDSDKKTFVVTSSVPAEGKSTISVNQAVTLALAGQSVVLVDGDLRRPQVARRLALDDAVGTTTVLIGRVPLDDALQPYGSSGLQVLTSGPVPPNPSELLSSHAMSDLLTDLRARFDVVIIDAPPLLPVTDAALMATQTDGAVVVVRHGKTSRDQLDHAIERLDAVEAATVGVVVNLMPARRASKGYGYGYGYGYAPLEKTPPPTSKRSKARRSAKHARDRQQAPRPATGEPDPRDPSYEEARR